MEENLGCVFVKVRVLRDETRPLLSIEDAEGDVDEDKDEDAKDDEDEEDEGGPKC